MPIITLLSDWGTPNTYYGQITGRLLTNIPDARVIELSPAVPAHDLEQAAYILQHTCYHYPAGTVHLVFIGLNKPQQKTLLIHHDGQFFLMPDSGLISLVFESSPQCIFELPLDYADGITFKGRISYITAATLLAKGLIPEEFAVQCKTYNQLRPVRPTYNENDIMGQIIHIDPYGNAITNITKGQFKHLQQSRPFTIYLEDHSSKIEKINADYTNKNTGELMALFNSNNHLEIAVSQGNAAQLLNLSTNSEIRVKFEI
ncbi:hypothetical protein DMA11_13020 [Marinilabiliaceae bacterium JC017]|nr:hypothetical protein DMA11_13020 [Marinilabiliaceae bacterium JC017]